MSRACPRPVTRLPVPFVYRDDSVIVLHFEIDSVQSMMDERQPDRLLLNYTRLMMAVLLFVPHPRHIGCIGLGGGSVPKYCYRHLPQSRITVAELNPAVIALRNTFQIPADNHRFRIVQTDGADFVASYTAAFDVLMVDAFDLHGQPEHLCTRDFYEACHASLTSKGFLVVNLCHAGIERAISRIERVFGHPVYRLKDVSGQNQVVLIGKEKITSLQPTFTTHARDLESTHALPLEAMALSLINNSEPRLIKPEPQGSHNESKDA